MGVASTYVRTVYVRTYNVMSQLSRVQNILVRTYYYVRLKTQNCNHVVLGKIPSTYSRTVRTMVHGHVLEREPVLVPAWLDGTCVPCMGTLPLVLSVHMYENV